MQSPEAQYVLLFFKAGTKVLLFFELTKFFDDFFA